MLVVVVVVVILAGGLGLLVARICVGVALAVILLVIVVNVVRVQIIQVVYKQERQVKERKRCGENRLGYLKCSRRPVHCEKWTPVLFERDRHFYTVFLSICHGGFDLLS